MDHLQTRLKALEQRTQTVARQLRWWRGLACGLIVVGLLSWGLPLGLAQWVAALEDLLKQFSREGTEVFITRANLHIRNSLGETACGSQSDPEPNCTNGRGNLIVGYNEPREGSEGNVRTGSHNVVVGPHHHYTRSAGLVVGDQNDLLGDFSTVLGYANRTEGATSAAVGGRFFTTASGFASWAAGSDGEEFVGRFLSP